MSSFEIADKDAGFLHWALAGCKIILDDPDDTNYGKILDPFGQAIGLCALTLEGDEIVEEIHLDRGGSLLVRLNDRQCMLYSEISDALLETLKPGLRYAFDVLNGRVVHDDVEIYHKDDGVWEEDAVAETLRRKIELFQKALASIEKGAAEAAPLNCGKFTPFRP